MMRKEKSGKDIIDGLERQIDRAEKALQKLDIRGDDDCRRWLSGRNTLKIMRGAKHLLDGLIGDLPAPERPAKRKATQGLPNEPTLTA